MRSKSIIKSVVSQNISDNDLNLINKYAVKPLKKDDVKVFNVTLCDNDIDRDFECFSINALNSLSKLFVGKPGIMDHSMRSSDQVARIFECEVKKSDTKLNSLGYPYYSLVAKAYILKNNKNDDIINDIEGGIKKEVSVNCCISEKLCSVCGRNYDECHHQAGKLYDIDGKSKVCYVILDKPFDAYEWSFVAVPAQKNAGITKSFKELEYIADTIKTGNGLKLSKNEADIISEKIKELKKFVADGEEYRKSVKKKFMKNSFNLFPNISGNILSSISDKLDISELKELSKSFESLKMKKSPCKSQFSFTESQNSKMKKENLHQFKI